MTGRRIQSIGLDDLGVTVDNLFEHLAPIETFTALFNATGHPDLVATASTKRPAAFPIGMQFVSRFGQEAMLLGLATALEMAVAWHLRRPIHVAN